MKKIIFAILIAMSANAYAGMWSLVKSDFVGNGWMCTYRLDNTNYVSTIFSKSYCQSFIFQ
ncbi:MAG: hypothetical protein UW55_C0024G0005 [Candidatus Giovannonibacteria bacterium GW2011_GWA2_44_26]|uniref:Secreted protein n=1 Tax=Candidatus Giovannonibacteria bacterium GW2011_GWA2_44_26 TaxID=1618648 RepID=A0A0G1IS47_9BACT|nr:MAG: hypothetical protein UW55_C0024G0005 [Candidatus Giovannonibacteria bacterium GW2011_GWA2_44_26]